MHTGFRPGQTSASANSEREEPKKGSKDGYIRGATVVLRRRQGWAGIGIFQSPSKVGLNSDIASSSSWRRLQVSAGRQVTIEAREKTETREIRFDS